MHTADSGTANRLLQSFTKRLNSGETVYLVGVGPAGHNSGVALIEVSQKSGIRLISNDEEERFAAIKHCEEFPKHAFVELEKRLAARGLTPGDVHAFLATC